MHGVSNLGGGAARRLARGEVAAGLSVAAVTLLYFTDTLTAARVFFSGDMKCVSLPARRYLAERLARGELPEWYPWDGTGSSFVGATVTGAFHPTALLHLLVPRALAFNLTIVLAHLAALLGAVLLLRTWGAGLAAALAGGLAYGFCGYLASMDSNLPYLLSAAAIPWTLWGFESGVERGSPFRLACGSLALASTLLGGDPQAFAVNGAAITVLALYPREGARRGVTLLALAGMLALAGVLSAAQLLPSVASLSEVVSGIRKLEEVQWHSLHPLRLVDLLIAAALVERPESAPFDLLDVRGFEGLWSDNLFVGAPVLALAAAAVAEGPRRPTRLLAAAACLTLALALGRHLPVWELVYRALPPWRAFRYPEKMMAFVSFALCALGGLGAQAVISGRGRRAFALSLVALVALNTALAVRLAGAADREALARTLVWLAQAPETALAEARQLLPAIARQTIRTAAVVLLAAGVLLVLLRRRSRLLAPALPGVIGGLALVLVRPTSETYREPAAVLEAPPPSLGRVLMALPSPRGVGRISSYDACNFASDFAIENAFGYLPLAGGGRRAALTWDLPREVYWRAFNVRFTLERVADERTLVERQAESRIRLARALPVESPEEALARMSEAGFDPSQDVAVEARDFPAEPPANGRVEVLRYGYEAITVRVGSERPTTLFVADAFASGWSATVSGLPARVAPANIAGRAIAIPAGTHLVELSYRDPGLRPGLALSALGLAGVAAAILFERRCARRQGGQRRAPPARTS